MIFLLIKKCLSQNNEEKCAIDFSTQVTANGVDFSGCKVYWEIRDVNDNTIVLDQNNSYPFKIAYIEYSPYIFEENGTPKGMMFGEYAQKRCKLNLRFIYPPLTTALRERDRIRRFSGPYISAFGLNTERHSVFLRIQSECGKIRTRKAPNEGTFRAVQDTD